jgi:chromosome partition protein MukE
MTSSKFLTLGDAVADENFPEVDLALRRGRHVDRDDGAWFGFLADAEDLLEPFYRRFGAELVYRADGFYYLLPTGDRLAKRQLGVAEMLVGQALTLLYLEPATVEQGGRVTREQVLGHLAAVMGTDALVRALNPKRRRYDERVAQETVRARVADAVRRLAALGFVETLGAEELKLRPALMRFAEPVRAAADAGEALSRLVASGELALSPLDSVPDADEPDADAPEEDELDADEPDADAPEEDEPSADEPDASAAAKHDDVVGAEPSDDEDAGFDANDFDDLDFEDVSRDQAAGAPGVTEPEVVE